VVAFEIIASNLLDNTRWQVHHAVLFYLSCHQTYCRCLFDDYIRIT